jgi:hypothetical protein
MCASSLNPNSWCSISLVDHILGRATAAGAQYAGINVSTVKTCYVMQVALCFVTSHTNYSLKFHLFCLQDFTHLAADDVEGLLQLSLNCSAPLLGELQAIRQLPAQLEPDVARTLLLRAAKRQHTLAAVRMLEVPAISCHLDDTTNMVVLSELLVHQREKLTFQHQGKLLARAHVVSEAVAVQLLLAAVRHGDDSTVQRVCGLRSTQHFSCSVIEQLLQEAVKRSLKVSTQLLCKRPAAQQLSSHAAAARFFRCTTYRWQMHRAAVQATSCQADYR